ncbi:MAG: hypothetical protein ACTSSB_11315 [Candidatus Heimdallarchaeota archaeon]
MTLPKKQKKKIRNFLLLAVIVIAIGLGAYNVLSPESIFTQTPATDNVSTFTLISYVDGEDVSNFVEISVWIPDDDAEFDETEDIYTLTNFEETKSSMDAEDVLIDLTLYDYVWIEIDPDAEQVFANNYHFISGGANFDYALYVYHQSSDVNFNVLDSTLDEIDLTADFTNQCSSDTYSVVFDVPIETKTNCHYGTNWAIEQSEFDDMSASEQAEVWDEGNWRCQAPTYSPAIDTEKEFDDDLD